MASIVSLLPCALVAINPSASKVNGCFNPHRPSLLCNLSTRPAVPSRLDWRSLQTQLHAGSFHRSSSSRRPSTVVAVGSKAETEVAESASSVTAPNSSTVTTSQEPSISDQLASMWRKVQGENNWKGFVDVQLMDPTFRAEIIRYGEFAQVNYDAFDSDTNSVYCGSSKYAPRFLFESVDKENCGYEVTRYLFSTSDIELPKFLLFSERDPSERWSGDSNWIAYVAVASNQTVLRLGRRDILVAWRGTIMETEWIEDIKDFQTRPDFEPGQEKVKVEKGFLSLYTSKKAKSKFNKTSAREQLTSELKRLLKKYEGEEVSISVAGHSLGSALAVLSGYDIAANIGGLSSGGSGRPPPMVTVFTFAGPRVGNWAFKKRVEELGLKVLRVVNVHDIVPNVPGVFFNEGGLWGFLAAAGGVMDAIPWAYYHVGQELRVDSEVSPYLRKDLKGWRLHHNLEGYLNVVDGFHGIGQPFKSVFNRDPAMVNKRSDFLVKKKYIPAHWLQERNKGLIKNELGQWVIAPRPDHHHPDNHNLEL